MNEESEYKQMFMLIYFLLDKKSFHFAFHAFFFKMSVLIVGKKLFQESALTKELKEICASVAS